MSTKIVELFGLPTDGPASTDWADVVQRQRCPYLNRKCLKNRKSQPSISIGTCTVRTGKDERELIICPHRMLERKQVFTDCLHLLTLHEPGHELHVVRELRIPGGSVDSFLVSARKEKVVDFVGVEFQTLDTTGTVWPERQRFLRTRGIRVRGRDAESARTFGINWKMTAKTILVQLHHKLDTFEGLNKHLVLVVQNPLLQYMRQVFAFDQIHTARLGDPLHLHSYKLSPRGHGLQMELEQRLSTDSRGMARCLGLQVSADVRLEHILQLLESKLSPRTLLTL